MPRPETSSDIPLQFSGQAPLATTLLIPLLPSYLTTITATPSTGPSDRSRGSVPGQPLYVRIERVTPPKRVLRSNGGRPKIRYEFIPVSDGSGDEVTRSSRRDEKRCVAEETSPVASASGPRRGKVTPPSPPPPQRQRRDAGADVFRGILILSGSRVNTETGILRRPPPDGAWWMSLPSPLPPPSAESSKSGQDCRSAQEETWQWMPCGG